jgi:hypothetical protein
MKAIGDASAARGWAVVAIALAVAAPVLAHHSDSLYFVDDRGSEGGAVRIEGTVTRVRLINPHAELFVEVVNEAGETERWAIESDSWNELRTLGWAQNTIEVGDRVAVVVSMSKFHKTAGRLRDLLIYGASPTDDARLFLEYIPDASDESGQSDAPLRLLDHAPQCDGMVPYDPARERGEETLLCVSLDAQTMRAVREEFADQIRIFR